MHWLIVALLVSVGGLLLAAAGMARHILLHRRKLRADSPIADATVMGLPEESDSESRI